MNRLRVLVLSVIITSASVCWAQRGSATEPPTIQPVISGVQGSSGSVLTEAVVGRFSPDGARFAFTAGTSLGIYDVRPQQLKSAIEVQRGDGNLNVAWSRSGLAYVSRPRTGSADEFFVVTEPDSRLHAVQPIETPDDVLAVFRLRQPDDDRLQENGTYTVWLEHELHGIKLIRVRERNKPGVKKLTTGSWELESYLFDRERSMVIYPVQTAGPDAGIVLAKLRTFRSQTLKLPNTRDLRLLDRHPKINMVAYAVEDACDARSSKQGAAVQVCFARW